MFIFKSRYSIWVRAISLAVVCLFLVNDIAWADPFPPKRATLAPPGKMANVAFMEEVAFGNFRLSFERLKDDIDKQVAWEKEKFKSEWKVFRTELINGAVFIRVSGLLAATGQFACFDLTGEMEASREFNGLPVIYIDSRYCDTPDKCVQKHELTELLQWENLRLNVLGIYTRSGMAEWVDEYINSPDERLNGTDYEGMNAREIAKRFCKNSYPLDTLRGQLSFEEDSSDLDFGYMWTLAHMYRPDPVKRSLNISAKPDDGRPVTPASANSLMTDGGRSAVENEYSIEGVTCGLQLGFHVSPMQTIAKFVVDIYKKTGIKIDMVSHENSRVARLRDTGESIDETKSLMDYYEGLMTFAVGLGDKYSVIARGPYPKDALGKVAEFIRDVSLDELAIDMIFFGNLSKGMDEEEKTRLGAQCRERRRALNKRLDTIAKGIAPARGAMNTEQPPDGGAMADTTTVAEWYGKMSEYALSQFDPSQFVYQFFNEAGDSRKWKLHPELGATLGVDEAAYASMLSRMTIPEIIDEYEMLEPDEYVHKDKGLTLSQLTRFYFCGHLLGQERACIRTYDDALENSPEFLEKHPEHRLSAICAKKKLILYREWAYRHWDESPKAQSHTIFDFSPEQVGAQAEGADSIGESPKIEARISSLEDVPGYGTRGGMLRGRNAPTLGWLGETLQLFAPANEGGGRNSKAKKINSIITLSERSGIDRDVLAKLIKRKLLPVDTKGNISEDDMALLRETAETWNEDMMIAGKVRERIGVSRHRFRVMTGQLGYDYVGINNLRLIEKRYAHYLILRDILFRKYVYTPKEAIGLLGKKGILWWASKAGKVLEFRDELEVGYFRKSVDDLKRKRADGLVGVIPSGWMTRRDIEAFVQSHFSKEDQKRLGITKTNVETILKKIPRRLKMKVPHPYIKQKWHAYNPSVADICLAAFKKKYVEMSKEIDLSLIEDDTYYSMMFVARMLKKDKPAIRRWIKKGHISGVRYVRWRTGRGMFEIKGSEVKRIFGIELEKRKFLKEGRLYTANQCYKKAGYRAAALLNRLPRIKIRPGYSVIRYRGIAVPIFEDLYQRRFVPQASVPLLKELCAAYYADKYIVLLGNVFNRLSLEDERKAFWYFRRLQHDVSVKLSAWLARQLDPRDLRPPAIKNNWSVITALSMMPAVSDEVRSVILEFQLYRPTSQGDFDMFKDPGYGCVRQFWGRHYPADGKSKGYVFASMAYEPRPLPGNLGPGAMNRKEPPADGASAEAVGPESAAPAEKVEKSYPEIPPSGIRQVNLGCVEYDNDEGEITKEEELHPATLDEIRDVVGNLNWNYTVFYANITDDVLNLAWSKTWGDDSQSHWVLKGIFKIEQYINGRSDDKWILTPINYEDNYVKGKDNARDVLVRFVRFLIECGLRDPEFMEFRDAIIAQFKTPGWFEDVPTNIYDLARQPLTTEIASRPPESEKTVVARNDGDIKNALEVRDTILPEEEKLDQGIYYTVHYNNAKILYSSVEYGALETYVNQFLQIREEGNEKFKLVGSRDEGKGIIWVECYKDIERNQKIGEGHVDIKDISGGALNIPAMMNMALVASHIPTNTKMPADEIMAKYDRLISFIRSQYEAMMGKKLSDELVKEALKFDPENGFFVTLPHAEPILTNDIPAYYRHTDAELKSCA